MHVDMGDVRCERLARGALSRITIVGGGGVLLVLSVIGVAGFYIAGFNPFLGSATVFVSAVCALVLVSLNASICSNGVYRLGLGPFGIRRDLSKWAGVSVGPFAAYRGAPIRGIGRCLTNGRWQLLPGSGALGEERRAQWVVAINEVLRSVERRQEQ